jgi:SAM-dependent methyltransferase
VQSLAGERRPAWPGNDVAACVAGEGHSGKTAPVARRTVSSALNGASRRGRAALDALLGRAPASSVDPAARPPGWWDLLPFTTHRIELAPGIETAPMGVDALDDARLDALLDACGGSLEGRTIVDLGCLEGGFTLGFAALGADRAVGIEARKVSVERCELARDLLGLANATFVRGDVKEELVRLGRFEVVFAAGILYHVADPATLLVEMRRACTELTLIDTHVARPDVSSHGCSELVSRTFGGREYRGRMFPEYAADGSDGDVEDMVWAAWGDSAAFWPLEDDLVAMIGDAGFASVEKVDLVAEGRAATWYVDQTNRVVYLARP